MTLKEIGQRVKDAREQRGLTQVELAKQIEINSTTLSLIETGSRRNGKELLDKVADFLNIEFELTIPIK
jgi:transcriptional regulator with XRE-family HTH domain